MSQREHGMLLSAGRMWRRQWRMVLWHCSRFWRLLQCHREACLRSSQIAQLVVGYMSLKVGYMEQVWPVLVWAGCLDIFFWIFFKNIGSKKLAVWRNKRIFWWFLWLSWTWLWDQRHSWDFSETSWKMWLIYHHILDQAHCAWQGVEVLKTRPIHSTDGPTNLTFC